MSSRETAALNARHDDICNRMSALHAAHPAGDLGDDQAEWDRLDGEAHSIKAAGQRQARLEELDRRAHAAPVGTGDDRLDAELARVGVLDAIRGGMGLTDAGACRAREMSDELSRRSGRKCEGIFWSMRAPASVEQRVQTTGLPAGGPGGNLIGTDFRHDLFIDRLRNGSAIHGLGARVLSGLSGNLSIPRRTASVAAGWVAENSALPTADPEFDQITMMPKHAGVISEWSRNMVLQSSPDVEQLARDDMSLALGEQLDLAAVNGSGAANQPRGVLKVVGIGSVVMGATGGALTLDAVSDLIGQVADANAETGSLGFLTNTKVRRAASKLKDTQARPYGVATVFQGIPTAFTNLVPSNGTKGAGSNLSSLIYGNWSDLLIGLWSELDILVNPFESTAYAKGNVQIRAMMTVDIAVRHPESFAAITDIAAP